VEMAEEDWGRCQRRTLIGVRLTPKSGHQSDVAPCPLCAKRQHRLDYSITSSATILGSGKFLGVR
jgi:hypothetical protein